MLNPRVVITRDFKDDLRCVHSPTTCSLANRNSRGHEVNEMLRLGACGQLVGQPLIVHEVSPQPTTEIETLSAVIRVHSPRNFLRTAASRDLIRAGFQEALIALRNGTIGRW
jgi:hypothetical protein